VSVTKNPNAMTDRERILVNIAAELAHEVEYYQRLPVVQAHERQWPDSARRIRAEWSAIGKPKYEKGDLVVCFTSTGRQQNPWLISFVDADGCKDDSRGLLLRAIGTDKLCDYSNESFIRITGIPARLLWEGDQYQFSLKLHKALNRLDNYTHVFRGLEFPEPDRAIVYIGERWGGLGKPTKPYTVEIRFTKRTNIKAIITALQAAGFGTREFEPDDGTYNGPMQGLTVIRRDDVVRTLQASGVNIK
jgi:hypothetical protein